jgi:hypothetical protein
MLEILAIHNHLPNEPARPHQYLFDRSVLFDRYRIRLGSILRGEALPTNVGYNRARASRTNQLCQYN